MYLQIRPGWLFTSISVTTDSCLFNPQNHSAQFEMACFEGVCVGGGGCFGIEALPGLIVPSVFLAKPSSSFINGRQRQLSLECTVTAVGMVALCCHIQNSHGCILPKEKTETSPPQQTLLNSLHKALLFTEGTRVAYNTDTPHYVGYTLGHTNTFL